MAMNSEMKSTERSSVAPKISIVMAAYNEEGDIGRALESILAQSFVEWELIVIDDGSTDSTADIVRFYAEKDSRINLVCNDTNLELSASLNKGIGLSRADLIARADADDINLPERLAKQYKYLQIHHDVDVLGTAAYLLDENGHRANSFSYPETHSELEALPFLKIQFFHPSVMIRRRFFETAGLYNPDYPNAEDKEMWLRGLSAGCRYANLGEPLIEYSTDGYVKSWRSICRNSLSLLRISRDLEIKSGNIHALVQFLYTAAIKLRIYKPKSLRLHSASRA